MTEQELEKQRVIAKQLKDEIEEMDAFPLSNQIAHLVMEDYNFQVECVLFDLFTNFDNRGNVIGESAEWLKGTTYTKAETDRIYDFLYKVLRIAKENGWWTIAETDPIVYDLRPFAELQAEGYWD